MASGTIVRELLVKLGVDADDKNVKAFDEAVESAKGHLDNLTEAATYAAAALAALVGGLVVAATDTSASAAAIQDQAAALGISTDAYQELTYAAEKAGGSSEDVVKTLSKLNVAGEQAAEGNEAAADALAAVGITADELANASPEEVLAMVADGLAGIEDPAARAAAATALLGDDLATKMLPVLGSGAEGLAAVAAEAEALGIIMDGDALDAAASFDDQLDQLTALLTSLEHEIGLAIIPVLSDLVSGFMEWIAANREAIATGIDDWVGTVGELLIAAADALELVNDAIGGAEGWKTLAEVVASLGAAGGLVYVVSEIIALASSLYGAATAGLAIASGLGEVVSVIGALIEAGAPLGVVLEAVVGAGLTLESAVILPIVAGIGYLIAYFSAWILVLQDLYTYLTGGDSVFGRLIERFQEAGGGLGALGNVMAGFGAVAEAVLSRVGQLFDWLTSLIDPAIGLLLEFAGVIEGAVMVALDALAPVLDTVAAGLNAVAGLIGVAPGTTSAAGTGTYATGEAATSTPTISSAATAPSVSYAPSATAATGASAGTVSQSVTQGNITVTGVGISADEAKALITDILEQQARETASSFATGEV